MRELVAVCLLVLMSGAAAAQSMAIANNIVEGCRDSIRTSPSKPYAAGYCTGAVTAIMSTAADICAPAGSTIGQSIRVVVHFLDNNPARMHENFPRLAAEALAKAWPCRQR